jgi:uncharacterized membrane protein
LAAALSAFGLLSGATGLAVGGITVIDLGALPGYSQSGAAAINARGVVVGESVVPGARATIWTPRATGGYRVSDLGSLASGADSWALGINRSGLVVGTSMTGTTGRAVLWRPKAGGGYRLVDLGSLVDRADGSTAWAINAAGAVVGDVRQGPDLIAYEWIPRGATYVPVALPAPAHTGRQWYTAHGISAAGVVVGTSSDPSGSQTAILWQPRPGGYLLVRLAPLVLGGSASWINSRGTVAGSSFAPASRGGQLSAVLWSPGPRVGYTVRELPSPPGWGWSEAFQVNAAGLAVGTATTAGIHAVAWVPGILGRYWSVDLGTLPGGGRSDASAVNDTGTIVGGSTFDASDELHAALWRLPMRE